MITQDFADRVALLCFNQYDKLPKTGKPNTDKQWTILSCIVEYNEDNDSLKVVSLGSGSKCLGRTEMSIRGDRVNDSHSEVLARRGFLRYIYDQILSQCSTFIYNADQNCFCKATTLSYHFFSTQVPCGDASIFPKSITLLEIQNGDDFKLLKRKHNDLTEDIDSKKTKLINNITSFECEGSVMQNDIFRTGAKCLESCKIADSKKSGSDYHVLGALRTKPGRGDPTLSMSCSDKLARWNMVGVQGALLSILLEQPIYFESIIISNDAPYSADALYRSIMGRWNIDRVNYKVPYKINCPKIIQSSKNLLFIHSKNPKLKQQPCPSGIVWCSVQKNPLEVLVDGYKQGVTKSMKEKGKGSSLISRKQFLKQFFSIISKYPYIQNKIFSHDKLDFSTYSYESLKSLACTYQHMWNHIRLDCFETWANKSNEFKLFSM